MTTHANDVKVLCCNIKSSFAVLFMGSKTKAVRKEKPIQRNYIEYQSYDDYFMRLTGNLSPYINEKKPILKSNKRENSLSKKSQSRIRNYVNLLLDTAINKEIYSKKDNKRFIYKIGFCTLTLPADFIMSDDKVHKKIFKPFIRVLQDKYDLAEYIWKAETQDNDQLHYHLTITQWIHWFIINREWRKQIQKCGYTYKSEKHKRAATEIHSVKKVKSLAAYLCKYLAKSDEWKKDTPQKIIDKCNSLQVDEKKIFIASDGVKEWRKRIPNIKLWDCSQSLKKEKLTLRNIIDDYGGVCLDLAGITVEEIQKDFFSLCIYDIEQMRKTVTLGKIWTDYINRIRQPDKQKPLYEIDSLKYDDSQFTYN